MAAFPRTVSPPTVDNGFSFPSGPPKATELDEESFLDEEEPEEEEEYILSTPEEEPEEEEEYILSTPDETSDVILDVEGREFHTSRAVLAHYSPVFKKMLFSDFKEKDQQKIPLPEKKFDDMVEFFNVFFWQNAQPSPVSDENIIQVLTLADEYQVDQVKVLCQNYIGDQLFAHFENFYNFYTENQSYAAKSSMGGQSLSKQSLMNKLILYLWACDQYSLYARRQCIKSLLVALTGDLCDVSFSPHYKSLPKCTKIELLETLCVKFRQPAVKKSPQLRARPIISP